MTQTESFQKTWYKNEKMLVPFSHRKVGQIEEIACETEGKFVGKGENAGYQHFILFL